MMLPDPSGTCQLSIEDRESGRGAHVRCDCGWRSPRYDSAGEAVAAALVHDGVHQGQGVPSRPVPSQ